MYYIKLPTGQKRINQACDRCRIKKIKCNGQLPCANCQRVDYKCEISHKLTRNSFPKGYTKNLERKVVDLENEIELYKHFQEPLETDVISTKCTFHEFSSVTGSADYRLFMQRYGTLPFRYTDSELFRLVLGRFFAPEMVPLDKLAYLAGSFSISAQSLNEICLLLYNLVLCEDWSDSGALALKLLSFGKGIVAAIRVDSELLFIYAALVEWLNKTASLDLRLWTGSNPPGWFELFMACIEGEQSTDMFRQLSLKFANENTKKDYYMAQNQIETKLDLAIAETVNEPRISKICSDFRSVHGISVKPEYTDPLLDSFDLDIFKWNNTSTGSDSDSSAPALSDCSTTKSDTPSLFTNKSRSLDMGIPTTEFTVKHSLLETFTQSLTSNKLNSIQPVEEPVYKGADDYLFGDYEDMKNLKRKVLNL